MPRFKAYSYDQDKLIPIRFSKQNQRVRELETEQFRKIQAILDCGSGSVCYFSLV